MERILIIEDDLHIGDMVARVLTKEGYAVSRSYSGTEALFVIAENEPDLVLLDLMLPGFSGEELLDKLSAFPVFDQSCFRRKFFHKQGTDIFYQVQRWKDAVDP